MRSSSCIALLIMLLPSIGVGRKGTAQTSSPRSIKCDSAFLTLARGENGYQPRGDRCEGLYAVQVGGALTLAGIARSDSQSLANSTKLRIAWPRVTDSIALVARSTHSSVFYVMTTVRGGAQNTFEWPLELSSSEGL